VPAYQLKAYNIIPFVFTSPPWNAIPNFNVGFYPMAVGLAYFVPSDVSFSCWFLSVLSKLVYVVAAVFGVEASGMGASRFPYREEQAAGAWIAFAGLVIWGSRYHLRTVMKSVSSDERAAAGWLWASAVICTLLCAVMMVLLGFPAVAALGVILIYAAYVITGARVRAEAGGQWTFAPLWTPHYAMNAILGTHGMSTANLATSGYLDLVHVDIRAQSLPYLMEGMAVAERTGIRWRTVLIWVGIGTVTALAVGWWATLAKLYGVGAATAKANPYPVIKAQISFAEVERLASAPRPWDRPGVTAMTFGAGLTILLAWWRRLGLYGLHPVGYVLCNTLTMNAFIVPFFMAWLAKTLVLRFGGNRLYRKSVSLFVGIVLGDVVTQAVWALIGWAFNVPIYQFLT